MKQIRNGVFETNSSSTHSIAIPRSCDKQNYISFRIDEFGWGFDEVNPADYFYTAIYETSSTISEAEEKVEKLKDILMVIYVSVERQVKINLLLGKI